MVTGKHSLLALIVTLGIVSCTSGPGVSPTPTVTRQPQPTRTATVTPAPPPTSTSTLTPTSTPTPTPTELPEFPTSVFPYPEDDYLFVPPDRADCLLPCWNGLRIGVSDLPQFHEVVNEVFGFDETNTSLRSSVTAFYGLHKKGSTP